MTRARVRLSSDRWTLGLAVLLAVLVVWAIVEAAVMPPPPFDSRHTLVFILLLATGAGAAGALVLTWRTRPDTQFRLAPRELLDAVELPAMMIVDSSGDIRHWSRGCEELYGWPAATAVGCSRAELLQTQRALPMAEFRQTLLDHGRYDCEIAERHRDGRELIIHESTKLFIHPDGRRSGVVVVNDVTGWRRAEAALRLSEARLATAVAVQGIFIYEYDLVSDQPIWTTRGESFFGMADADGAEPQWQWTPEHGGQIRDVLAAAVANENDRAHFDFDFHYPDGTARRAEGWARIIRDDEGQPIRLLGTLLDVTERREREQALRAGETERHAILSTVRDAMFVCNERGVIRACSAAACVLFGYEEADLIGRALIDLVEDGNGRAAVRRHLITTAYGDPATPWPVPINIKRSDGTVIPISFVIGEAMVEGSTMYVVVGRDMRSTIATEERFHRLSNELAQVSRLGMMGEMAAALAHELSQPLSAIVNFLGAADLMLDSGTGADAEPLRHAIHCASDQSSRAGEIIRRLRAFILRGESDMCAEPLVSLIREAAALALFNTSSFGVRLAYELEDEGRIVLGDRVQIQQVLVNLIRNGADAMTASGGEKRDMTISTRLVTGSLIEVSVRDSGPGIAPEMLEKLFSPFATTKREGLGFGLAISRRIIEAHGGQLSASSAPEGGAIFRFTLPVMDGEQPEP